MSYRERGLVHGFAIDTAETEDIKIGEIVAVQADGEVLKTVSRNGFAYYPVVENSAVGCNVASAQLTGVAKVRIVDGTTVNPGDVMVVDTAEARAIVGAVADKTAAIYLGVALEAGDGVHVPVLLGR